MPPAIGKPCAEPLCGAIVTRGKYCAQHRRKAEAEDRRRRGSAAERGYDHRWTKYRETFLAQYPLCGMSPNRRRMASFGCQAGGRVAEAKEIDHIIPRADRMDLFWEPRNHQALCLECHRAKSAEEARGRGAANL